MFDPREARRRLRRGEARDVAAALLAAAADEGWERSRDLQAMRELGTARALLPPLEEALRDGADAGRRNAARSVLAAMAGPGGGVGVLRRLERLATGDLDPDVRVLAATALGESGNPAARPALERALADPDSNVAAASADALGELGDTRAVDALAAVLAGPDPWRAIAAAVALGRLRDARALPALGRAMGDPLAGPSAVEAIGEVGDPAGLALLAGAPRAGSAAREVLDAAAAILAAHPAPPPPWVRELASAGQAGLEERFARGEDAAALLLGAAGTPEAAAALAASLADPERAPGAAAAMALLPPPVALAVLLPRLEGAEPAEREEILSALPPLPDRRSAERVAALLADPADEVRALAAEALAGAAEGAGVRELLAALLADPARREGAARALGRLPGGACDLLAGLLDDDGAAVRRAAAEGIARCPGPGAAARVERALRGETDPAVRPALVAALGATGGADAVEPLARLAREGDPAARFAAVRALGRTGAPGALPPLLEALAGGDPALEVAALSALGELGDPRGASPVEARLEEDDREVRRAAAAALRRLAPPAAAGRLVRALDDGDWRIRLAAARTLGRLGDPEALPALRRARDGDPDPLVRQAAARALGEG